MKREYKPHPARDKQISEAILIVKEMLKLDISKDMKAKVIYDMIWNISGVDYRNKIRFQTVEALKTENKIIQHEHVYPIKLVIEQILKNPTKCEAILRKKTIGCMVTKDEHKLLNAVDKKSPGIEGWIRYDKANIKVFDLLENKVLNFSELVYELEAESQEIEEVIVIDKTEGEKAFYKYMEEAEKAKIELGTNYNLEVSGPDIWRILAIYFDTSDLTNEIFRKDLESEQIVRIVLGFNYYPIASIELEESILPKDVATALKKAFVKSNGEVWEIHKNDSDPFPSHPHAHNYENNYKLHLGNGKLYYKMDCIGKISKKNLLNLRAKIQHQVKDLQLPMLLV